MIRGRGKKQIPGVTGSSAGFLAEQRGAGAAECGDLCFLPGAVMTAALYNFGITCDGPPHGISTHC